MSNTQVDGRTLTMKRTFAAPVALVWEAWTRPEHIASWWGPPGMEVKIQAHDFQVGGQWRYSMTMPNGAEFITEGVYKVIEEWKKIFSSADFKPMTEGVDIQAIFEEAGEQTHFTFNVVHATAEYAQQQKDMGFDKGWGSVFDNLANFLQQQQG
ncbi:MAG: SRPBCC domain-containing protein [Bacteroidota bacterium]